MSATAARLGAVDCGVANDATRAAWEQVLAPRHRAAPLLRVFATHCHPDHVGLSDWLCSKFDAPFWITTGEYGFARMMAAALPGVDGPAAMPHFQRHGLVDPDADRADGRAPQLLSVAGAGRAAGLHAHAGRRRDPDRRSSTGA